MIVFLLILLIIPNQRLKDKIYSLIDAYKEKMLYNGVILSIIVIYFSSCEKFYSQKQQSTFSYVSVAVEIFASPIIFLIILMFNDNDDLRTEKSQKTMGNGLYQNVKLK